MREYRRGRLLKRVFRIRFPSRLYDWNAGWLLTTRICRITHTGRKSGRRYRTVLEVVGTDPGTGEVMVVSGVGRTGDWYRNLLADPASEVETGRRHFKARARELSIDEAAAMFADYERRNRFMRPIVLHLLSKLVGWRYDGSDTARRKLVEELPMVAFTPTASPTGPNGGPDTTG